MWGLRRKERSGFSARSTAEEVTLGIDGAPLTAIVTGASRGIGGETTRVLALRGVHVVMAVRNTIAGEEVKKKIAEEIPTAKVDVMEIDLSSMASVRKFASKFKASNLPLNILINNAGVLTFPFQLSKDGIELHFATNYLGHYLLTHLLLDVMKEMTKKTGTEGRIINLTSSFYDFTYDEKIRFDKLNDQSGYRGFSAYAQSKLANILHVNELARRLKDDEANITANSVNPRWVATHILGYDNFMYRVAFAVISCFVKSVGQGAATTCYVALHPQVKGVSGKYFNDNSLAKRLQMAEDVELARKLWDFSMDLINAET